MAYTFDTSEGGMAYPLTKMNFLVTLTDISGAMAAFSEVSGIDATVDVIEFRQGNSSSLASVKIPGLVKYGNLTLKMGYTLGNGFKDWVAECVGARRSDVIPRTKINIELRDIREDTPQSEYESTAGEDKSVIWVLDGAWATKYTAPDLNASTSEVAIETVEICYESLTIPN